ncbi:MAG: flagellar biosynthesis protein FlhF [Bacillus sp. (in: firmicutes)]
MKIKKYTVSSITKAMELIRADLGEDAVILHSKEIFSGGLFGFLRKKNVEVIAAVEPTQKIPARKRSEGTRGWGTSNVPPSLDHDGTIHPSDQLVLKEIEEVKKLVKSLSPQIELQVHPVIDEIVSCFREQGLARDTVKDATRAITSRIQKREIDIDDCLTFAAGYLESLLPKDDTNLFRKKYINVVGPTGVGKTTTLAKLAAHNMLYHGKKVAFITTDTYRIAAVDQLKTYAEIMNVPVEVAYTSEDFKAASKRLESYDLVFIDTAGRNFRNKEYVDDLNRIVAFDEQMETYLVLSVTSKESDMESIIGQFSHLPISHFIFTKIDETATYGSMINVMIKHGKNVAFMTDGQVVPDNLIKADSRKVIQLVMGGLNR